MPAEWEPHEATWIGWPHNASDWPGRFGPIPWAYAEISRWILRGERLRILIDSAAHEARARRVLRRSGLEVPGVEFFRVPTDRGWIRDSGPAFVVADSPRREVAVRRFRFNGWAKYPDWRRDDRVPERVARALGLR
ncbi:MAG: agmatine deiminase family protein, partial [Thermoanaerobaculia bacterium]